MEHAVDATAGVVKVEVEVVEVAGLGTGFGVGGGERAFERWVQDGLVGDADRFEGLRVEELEGGGIGFVGQCADLGGIVGDGTGSTLRREAGEVGGEGDADSDFVGFRRGCGFEDGLDFLEKRFAGIVMVAKCKAWS